MESVEIFGIEISLGTRQELYSLVKQCLGRGGRVATVNPLMLMAARESEEFRRVLADFDIKIPDGYGIAAVCALLGKRTEVLPGVELGKMLLSEGKMSLALFGAAPGIARRAMNRLKAEFSSLSEAFVLPGYGYSKNEVYEALSKTRPTVAFFCLSSPKQELLIGELCPASPNTLYLGLGGSLDVYSGAVRRAPKFFRSLRLEWLFRALRQPQRLLRIPQIFAFLVLALREKREVLTKKEDV